MINGLVWLVCAALYYGLILPVKTVVRAITVAFLMVACASGAYIVGCFLYGVYTGLNP